MKLKDLKSRIVIAMAIPFLQEHGTKSKNPNNPSTEAWVQGLHMMLWSYSHSHVCDRIDIWDYNVGGKKVFSVGIAPLDIVRCDTGAWFDLFLTCFSMQASTSIEKYLEVKEAFTGLQQDAGRRLILPIVPSDLALGNSITK